jgi:hypothetical protein
MDAITIFLIGTLPEAVDKPKYKEAAEHALLSLSESPMPQMAFTENLQQLVTLTCVPDKTEVVANKPDEKITFTVTLEDIDAKPLSGVKVYWLARLGSIATAETDTEGKVKAEFSPGKVMGTDTPQFWLDLFEPQYAPTLNVVADTQSLQFPPSLMSPVPLGTVPHGQEVELYVTLMDRYLNLGKNSLVRWSYKVVDLTRLPLLVIRPAQTFTNQEGVARVFASSPTGGTFEISVLSEAGEFTAHFESITFDGEEAGQ